MLAYVSQSVAAMLQGVVVFSVLSLAMGDSFTVANHYNRSIVTNSSGMCVAFRSVHTLTSIISTCLLFHKQSSIKILLMFVNWFIFMRNRYGCNIPFYTNVYLKFSMLVADQLKQN